MTTAIDVVDIAPEILQAVRDYLADKHPGPRRDGGEGYNLALQNLDTAVLAAEFRRAHRQR